MSIEMGHMPKWYLHLTQGVSKPTPACRAKSGNVIAHQQFVKPRWIETFCVDSFAWQAPGSAAGPIFHLNICFFLLHPYNHNFLSQTDSILIVWHLLTKMALLEPKIAVLEQKIIFLHSSFPELSSLSSAQAYQLKDDHKARLFAQEFQWQVSMYSALQSSLVIFNS